MAARDESERGSPFEGRFWLIHFDDADVRDEVFTDEAAARKRSENVGTAFNHTLFVEVKGFRETIHESDLKALHSALIGIDAWKFHLDEYCACTPEKACYLHGITLPAAEAAAERVLAEIRGAHRA